MRIVSIGPAPPWRGGIAHYHLALTRALEDRGLEVAVLNFGRLYPRLFFPGTSPVDRAEGAASALGEQILYPCRPLSWRRSAHWVRSRDPDAVLVHWFNPFFAPACRGVLARLQGSSERRPTVGVICHNVHAHERFPGSRLLTRTVLRRGDFFITGGSVLASEIARLVPGAPVEVVPHPRYDLPWTRSLPSRDEARRRLALPLEGPVFLSFGLIRAYKGLETFLEALALLPSGEPWYALIAGEFYVDREPYERQVERLGLAGRVRIEDRYIPNPEVPTYFAASDVCVLPFHHATQSGVAALSVALRRPVLTTRVGALNEAITEGREGWLVEPRDPVALAERLAAIIRDPDSARLPVCEGLSGLPGWDDLAAVVERLAAGPG